MTEQLALFELEAPAAVPGYIEAWHREYLAANVPDCRCLEMGCSRQTVADHGYLAGCRACACPATTLPEGAVELAYVVEFEDGCGIWVELRSHGWGYEVEGTKVWSPSTSLWGACSETGFLSHIARGNPDPGPGGWVGWGMTVAGEAHREWCCPSKKRGKR